MLDCVCFFFFFKQKTAYEMRISDWSSDVCSSDLWSEGMFLRPQHFQQFERYLEGLLQQRAAALHGFFWGFSHLALDRDALAVGKQIGRASCRERVCQYV